MTETAIFQGPAEQPTRSFTFYLLAGFLLLVFFLGGTSRADVQSLVILRPVSVMMCAFAVLTLTRADWSPRPGPAMGIIAIWLLTIAHILPLPASIWQQLPNRVEMVEINAIAGLDAVWRPVTLAPNGGWDAVWSLFTPLAVLLLGIQLRRNELASLLTVLIGLGVLSGLLGVLQIMGNADGPLYFYRITNNGAAVGLFANRNHAAVMLALLVPMLALWVSLPHEAQILQGRRKAIAGAIAMVLVPLILVTGSRSGLLAASLGLIAAALVYRRNRTDRRDEKASQLVRWGRPQFWVLTSVVLVGFVAAYFSRATAIERLFEQSTAQIDRSDFWAVSVDMLIKYFPFGSGSGSFPEAYQHSVPDNLLDLHFLNAAHNDWLEIAVTLSLPGILIIAVAIFAYVLRSFSIWRHHSARHKSTAFARMSGLAIAIICIASFFDYPLRTPIMMSVFAVLMLWFVKLPDEKSAIVTKPTSKMQRTQSKLRKA